MALWQWSTTPASNATAGSINWAEGQAPSTVNDSARQMMADFAVWYQGGPEWINYGLTPTYVSATQYTLVGNQTTIHSVGRRVRATVTAGTIYGAITASVFGSLTTVTVAWDSGSLDSGLSEVDVGLMNPLNPSLPSGMKLSGSGMTLTAPSGSDNTTFTINGSADSNGANIKLIGDGNVTPNKYLKATQGTFQIVNSAYNGVPMSMDDSGNVNFTGNVTSQSDGRFKVDWLPMQKDFIYMLASLKRGTYTRTDTGQRQIGVPAQDLQKFMPEAVQGVDVLSVAYGQAALVACAELASEVVRLRSLLEPAK